MKKVPTIEEFKVRLGKIEAMPDNLDKARRFSALLRTIKGTDLLRTHFPAVLGMVEAMQDNPIKIHHFGNLLEILYDSAIGVDLLRTNLPRIKSLFDRLLLFVENMPDNSDKTFQLSELMMYMRYGQIKPFLPRIKALISNIILNMEANERDIADEFRFLLDILDNINQMNTYISEIKPLFGKVLHNIENIGDVTEEFFDSFLTQLKGTGILTDYFQALLNVVHSVQEYEYQDNMLMELLDAFKGNKVLKEHVSEVMFILDSMQCLPKERYKKYINLLKSINEQ